MFVESFQGQYKDGTNGTYDFRAISASFLILRITILTNFQLRSEMLSTSAELICAFCICASCFYAIARPYKENFRNFIDILILFLLEFASLVTSIPLTRNILISTLLLGVPHMVLIFYICYVLAMKAGITQCLKRKYRTVKVCLLAAIHTGQAGADEEAESDNSLPDRLINPEEYEPLLPTRVDHAAVEPTEDREPVDEEQRRMTPMYTYGSVA